MAIKKKVTPLPDLAPLVRVIEEEKERFAKQADKEEFRVKIRKILNGRLEGIIRNFLGFKKDTFSGWVLDGSGSGPVSTAVRSMVERHVSEWLGDQEEELRKHLDTVAKKAVREWVRNNSGYQLRAIIRERMAVLLAEQLDEYLKDPELVSLMSLLKIGEDDR